MRAWILFLGLGACMAGCVGAESDDESADATQEDTSGPQLFVAVGVEKNGGDLGDLTKVKLADRTKTKCDDGKLHSSCPVEVDFSELHLKSTSAKNLLAQFNAKHAIVQGKIVASVVTNPSVPAVAVLKVSAAWLGATGDKPDTSNKYFRAHDRIQNEMCTQNAACGTVTLHKLNTTSTSSDIVVGKLDFDNLGATQKEITKAENLMEIGAAGLLVRGNTYFLNGGPGHLVINDFFLPVAKGTSN